MADKKKDLGKGGVVELSEEDLEDAQGSGTARTDFTSGPSGSPNDKPVETVTFDFGKIQYG